MTILPAMALAALLAWGSADDPVDPESYAAARTTVEHAMVEINTDPEQGRARLRAALERLQDFAPLLAEDPAALELRTLAELTLARAELASGDRYAAAAIIDATLEGLGGQPLPTERLGPTLGALVEERSRALAARGTARLRVECSVACRVLVDERNVGDVEAPGSARELALPLGTHRVWVEGLEGEVEPLRARVNLDTADSRVSLAYPDASADQAPAPTLDRGGQRQADAPFDGPVQRVAPRWAEVTTLVAGGAAVVAGAVLWALDSRCPGGADPNDVLVCPELYDTRNAGIALVSAGIAAGLTGGVMLIVDETRVGDRRGRELGLVWKVQF